MSNISQRYSHFFYNSDPHYIAHSRSNPAVILLNYELKIVYYNTEAAEFINSNPSSCDSSQEIEKYLHLPSKLLEACNKYKTSANDSNSVVEHLPLIIENPDKNQSYLCFRVLPMLSPTARKAKRYDPYFIVLVERIVCPTRWFTSFKLSKREIEVLELLFMGYSNKEIADQLCIAAYTVEDHIKSIIRKFKVKNRLSIITKFLESYG